MKTPTPNNQDRLLSDDELRQKPVRKLMSYLGFEWNQWRSKYNLEQSTAELTKGDAQILANNFIHHMGRHAQLEVLSMLDELEKHWQTVTDSSGHPTDAITVSDLQNLKEKYKS